MDLTIPRFFSVSTSQNIAAYRKFLQGDLTLGKILSVTFWPIEYEPFNLQLCVTSNQKSNDSHKISVLQLLQEISKVIEFFSANNKEVYAFYP